MEHLDWFLENYIEDEEQCAFLLNTLEKSCAYTIDELYEGCFELRKWKTEKDYLAVHLKILGDLSMLGNKAETAGKVFAEIIKEIFNERDANFNGSLANFFSEVEGIYIDPTGIHTANWIPLDNNLPIMKEKN